MLDDQAVHRLCETGCQPIVAQPVPGAISHNDNVLRRVVRETGALAIVVLHAHRIRFGPLQATVDTRIRCEEQRPIQYFFVPRDGSSQCLLPPWHHA